MSDRDHARPKFPEPLVGWLDQHGALISALVMLRRGQEDEAVEALLQTRELQTLRLSSFENTFVNPTGPREPPRRARQRH